MAVVLSLMAMACPKRDADQENIMPTPSQSHRIRPDELRSDPSWTIDQRLQQDLNAPPFFHYYRNTVDGRVAILLGDEVRVFPSEKALREIYGGAQFLQAHLLAGRQPYAAAFPDHTDEVVSHLTVFVDPAVLDFSLDSLLRIEEEIVRSAPDRGLEGMTFTALVAYVGEVIRRGGAGTWVMVENRGAGVWEPWLELRDGSTVPLFSQVYEEIAEPDGSLSAYARALATPLDLPTRPGRLEIRQNR